MIKMLSRFDLKPNVDLETFEKRYYEFCARAVQSGLAVGTDKIGRRISETPMDTDAEGAQEFYVVMTFRDRDQLDQAYEYMNNGLVHASDQKPHTAIKHYVKNPVFTCWQE